MCVSWLDRRAGVWRGIMQVSGATLSTDFDFCATEIFLFLRFRLLFITVSCVLINI